MRPLPRASAVLTAVLAVGLYGCAGGDEVQEEIEALHAAAEARADEEDALAERITALEEELAILTAPVEEDEEDEDPFAPLQAALDELDDRVTALDASAATTEEATAAAKAAADTAATDLRKTLDGVRGSTDELKGQVEELRTLYESLRDRLDRHDRGHP